MTSNSDSLAVRRSFRSHWIIWGLALLACVGQVALYLSRWADDSLGALPVVASQLQISAALSGFALIAVLRLSWDLAKARSYVLAVLAPLSVTCLVYLASRVEAFRGVVELKNVWSGFGATVGALCFFSRSSFPPHHPALTRPFTTLSIYLLASCSYLLLTTPFSSHLPSIMENGQEFYWQNFYLGSIHTDISPIYVFPRSFINALSSAPVINATALVSLTLVSIALAISAFVVHATMGRLWAWGFLLLAWTDKWVMAASVASSLIAQPMTLTAAGLAFCVWALFRSGQSLRPRESWTAGCVVALGIIISFYSYSGVRFNWLCSVGLVGVILLARRALPLSLQGAAHAGRIIAPSIILLATLWLVLFRADSKAFSNQVFTSRDGWIFIESPVLQPAPVRPFNDVDVPMWWGSGIDTRINHVVYWKRTPRELFDRVVQYARQWSEVSNVEAYLVVLGVFALLVGLMSPIRERRLTLGLLGIFAIHSYLPIMIAQAPEAYRRGTFNAIALLLIITSLFASVPRAKFSRLISFIALAVFAVAKAPLELNPLLRTYMSIPLATNVCLACVGPGQLPLKRLVSSPTFQELRTQELFFLVNQSDMLLSQAGCMRIAMKSREMKELLPRGAEFEGTPGDLSASMKSLTSGQVLIVTCNSEFKTNEQIVRACQGLPPEGAAFLGEMPAEQLERYVWWVALKKL